MKNIRNLINPIIHEEPERKRISSAFRSILVAIFLILSLHLLVQITLYKINTDIVVDVTVLLIIGLTYFLNSINKTDTAVILFTVYFWCSMTFHAITNYGVKDVAVISYLICILIPVILTKHILAIILTVASIISLWILAQIEYHQLLNPGVEPVFYYSIKLSAFMIFILMLVFLMSKSYRDILKRMAEYYNEKLKAEELAGFKEVFYTNIFENANDGIFIIKNGLLVDCNQKALDIFKCTREQIFKHSPVELSPEKQPDGTLSSEKALFHINQAVKGVPQRFEWQHCRADKTVFDAEVTLKRLEINSEKLILSIIRDISERKKAERMIQDKERRIRGIFDLSMGLISLLDNQGVLLEINKTALEFAGIKEDDVVGNFFWETPWWKHSKDAQNGLKEAIAKALKGEIVCFESSHISKAGETAIIDTSIKPIFNENGEIILLITEGRNITENKKAEQKIRDSEERYHSLFEGVPVGLYRIAISGQILDCNSSAVQMLGYESPDELRQLNAVDLWVSPEKREEFLKRVNSTGVFSIEMELWKKDHTKIMVSNTGRQVKDKDGTMLYLEGSISDITEKHSAKEALRKSEEKFRRMFETSRDFMYITKMTGEILEINNSATSIAGYSRDELLQMNIRNLYAIPDERERIVEEVAKNGYIENLELTAKRKDGALIDILLTSSCIYDDMGMAIGFQGSAKDITERKQAERKIKESEERLQKLINSVTDYIYTVKIENNKVIETIHGEGCKAVTGYSAEEFRLNNYLWFEIVHPADKTLVQEYLDSINVGKLEKSIEHRIIHRNGTVHWVRNIPVLRYNSVGILTGYDGLISDISELKEAQRQILNATIEAEENEKRFFATELHDGIGPLLSAIKLYVQWLEKPKSKAPRKVILANASAVIDETITAVKEISQKLSPHIVEELGLVEAIMVFIRKIQNASEINIALNSDLKGRLDKEYEITLFRVLIECINNTIKYANAKNILIHISMINNQLNFMYTDNGIGFDYISVIKSGKGLGIINIKNRIERLGGTLKIESMPGKGVNIIANIGM